MVLWTTTLLLTLKAAGQVLWMLAGAAGTEDRLHLAAAPSGRIALHVLCAWQDHRFRWHWQGVARELTQVRVPRRIRVLASRPQQTAPRGGSAYDSPRTEV